MSINEQKEGRKGLISTNSLKLRCPESRKKWQKKQKLQRKGSLEKKEPRHGLHEQRTRRPNMATLENATNSRPLVLAHVGTAAAFRTAPPSVINTCSVAIVFACLFLFPRICPSFFYRSEFCRQGVRWTQQEKIAHDGLKKS